VSSYPCLTNGEHVVQGIEPRHTALVAEGDATGVTDWLWSGFERGISSKYCHEMLFSDDWSVDDVSNAAVNDLRNNAVNSIV